MRSERLDLYAQFCNDSLQNWELMNQRLSRTACTRIAYSPQTAQARCGGSYL